MKETILEMEEYAKENNVPIIQKDSIIYIMKYIKNKWSLSEQEVRGILIVDPEYLDDLLEFIPDKIPNDVKDIFIF